MYSVFRANSRISCRCTKQIGAVITPLLKGDVCPDVNQARQFAARKGKRAKMFAAKMEKKLQEASKPQPVPKFLAKRTKALPAALENRRVTDENWLEASILDDIWRLKLCRGKPYSVADAVALLQELCHPTMLNDPEAFVYATVELDLRLKKKNHFMEDFSGIILYPHDFETGSTKRVIALCESSDDQYKASEVGAAYVGGTSIIQRIYRGEIRSDDYDFVVCHPNLLKDCNKLRGLLKRKFPNFGNGLLRIDVDEAVKEFTRCTEFSASTSKVEPDFGWIDIHFGRLNMSPMKLEENLRALLQSLEKKKPAGPKDTLFITRTLLWCSRSSEKFKIPHWEYLPGYPVNGIVVPEDSADDGDEQTEAKG